MSLGSLKEPLLLCFALLPPCVASVEVVVDCDVDVSAASSTLGGGAHTIFCKLLLA